MRIDREYHHFKGNHLTRSEWVERFVVEQLVDTSVPDAKRESSQAWELMHSSTCKAFMHVLAEKRGIDVDLARVAGALHDYYVIKTGKYKNHAQLGAPLVQGILAQHGAFSDSEIQFVCEMVANHSDKHIHSSQPHVELIKDVDVFDCSLYHGTEFYYLTRKPLPVCHEYFKRVLRVREELGMPLPPSYQCLSKGDSGALIDIGKPITGIDEADVPTTNMIALWALASSTEALDWPLIMVNHSGGSTRWFAPRKFALPDCHTDGIPSWESIQHLNGGLAKQIDEARTFAHQGKVRELLQTCQNALVPAWGGYRVQGEIKEQAAVALRDFACDPKGDTKLESLIRSRMTSKQNDLGREQDPVDYDDWQLDAPQRESIDQLARLSALESLRGDLIRHSFRILTTASDSLGRDLAFQFPSDAFDCEESPRVQAQEDTWLAIAWPRFGRFEFVVGVEAEDRFAALSGYFATEKATKL